MQEQPTKYALKSEVNRHADQDDPHDFERHDRAHKVAWIGGASGAAGGGVLIAVLKF
jgi:hypothetical protein